MNKTQKLILALTSFALGGGLSILPMSNFIQLLFH